jgi:hypothetical protein
MILLVVLSGWGYLEYHYTIDYGLIYRVIKDEVMGVRKTCLDLPEEEWRLIPKCNPVRDSGGGVDSTEV